MKLWKSVLDGDRLVQRPVPVPPGIEDRESLLEMLGLSGLEGTGQVIVFPSGWYRGGYREWDIMLYQPQGGLVGHFYFTYGE